MPRVGALAHILAPVWGVPPRIAYIALDVRVWATEIERSTAAVDVAVSQTPTTVASVLAPVGVTVRRLRWQTDRWGTR